MPKRKPTQSGDRPVLAPEQVDRAIHVFRGQKVILDFQLAAFYGVETRRLVEQVKRNLARFPDDFMFQLTPEEWGTLRSQIAISNKGAPTQLSKPEARGGRRYAPYAFTEQGVAMLSSVLRSPRAIEINVQIMRAFVRLRQLLGVHKELAERLASLERQMRQRDQSVDRQFQHIFALLNQLFNPPDPPRRQIGFQSEREE